MLAWERVLVSVDSSQVTGIEKIWPASSQSDKRKINFLLYVCVSVCTAGVPPPDGVYHREKYEQFSITGPGFRAGRWLNDLARVEDIAQRENGSRCLFNYI